eukprot:773718_1
MFVSFSLFFSLDLHRFLHQHIRFLSVSLCCFSLYGFSPHIYHYMIHSFWLFVPSFLFVWQYNITDPFHFVFVLLINILCVFVFDICVRSDTKHQRSSFYFFFFSLLFLFEYESF